MTSEAENTDKKRRSLKPLTSLFPYLKRYRGLVAGALWRSTWIARLLSERGRLRRPQIKRSDEQTRL